MRRKLLILNLALVAAMVFAGVQLRKEWKAAKQREAATRNPKVTPAPVPPLAPAPQEPPVKAMTYAESAQKTLFHPSRDPNVPVEPPPPPPPAPPPPPPPPLPQFHGTMVLGGEAIALLSVAGQTHQGVKVGEKIGPFVVKDINRKGVQLEWNGQLFEKNADEIVKNTEAPAQGGGAVVTDNAPPAAPQPEPEPVKPGPGVETPYGIRTCSMNDGTAEGAVMDGYRKVVYTSPFGKTCGWEKVK